MLTCYQFPGFNMFEHGMDVHRKFTELFLYLKYGDPHCALSQDWKLPDWVTPDLLPWLLDQEILRCYHVYHDCGKPFCRTEDETGQHFPNHAIISARKWREWSSSSKESLQVAKLIEMDMDVHLLKAVGVDEFAARLEAVSLLLTGLAEIHSNAVHFGGTDSVGFKIKWKHLDKMGRKILAARK